MLCPSLVSPSLNVLPSSASSTSCSTKAPSAYTIQRNTCGCRCSLEDTLSTFVRVLSVQRGQLSCEGLPPLLGCLKIDCRTEGGTNQRLDGSEGCSRERESLLHPRGGFCLVRPVKSILWLLLVNRFAVLNIKEVNTDIHKPIDVPLCSALDRKVLS